MCFMMCTSVAGAQKPGGGKIDRVNRAKKSPLFSLETGTRTSGYRAGIKSQWWPRNSNLPGPSEP